MSLACRVAAIAAMLLTAALAAEATTPLRVCADPSNLPFSSTSEQGFENVLAHMVAHDLNRGLEFVWLPPQERGIERLLQSHACDLLMGIASSTDQMTASVPYYRSQYVFLSRRDRHIRVSTLIDPALANYRIGALLIGGDDEAVPPAQEMARHGFVRNIVGYTLYGHAGHPSADLVRAVERGDVDLAVVWGPLAGYFAKNSSVPLEITRICPLRAASALPVAFNISMGVRRGDDALLEQVNREIKNRRKEIRELLSSYGVPLVDTTDGPGDCR